MKEMERIFGSRARVRLMRLFLMNPGARFATQDLVTRTKEQAQTVRKELTLLEKVDMVRKTQFTTEARTPAKNGKPRKKTVSGYMLNPDFAYLRPLEHLLITSASIHRREVVDRIKQGGDVKLIVLSGIFIREEDSAVDLLVVGDQLKRSSLENTMRTLEADIGKELHYAFLDTKDFTYRFGMYDKFLRNIFDYPHEKLLDRLDASS